MSQVPRERPPRSRSTWSTPLAVFAIGALFLGSLWAFFERREEREAQRRLELLAEQVAARIESVVDSRLALVSHLRRRWSMVDEWTEQRWHAVGGQLRKDFSGLQSLNWVDADGRIRWVDPLEGNEPAVGADLSKHEVVGELFARDGWPYAGRVSPPVELMQGGLGFVLYLPLHRDGVRQGWVSGVFRVEDLVRLSLPEAGLPAHDLRVEDAESGEPLFILAEGNEPLAGSEREVSAGLQVVDRRWTLTLSPRPGSAAAAGTLSDEVFALGGLLLLAVAVLLLNRVLERGRELEESRARYRSLVESAPEAIVVLDVSSGRFVEANARAEELFGRGREELLRLGPTDSSAPVTPDGRPADEAARDYIARALAGEEPVFEWVHLDSAGREIPCEVRLRRLGAEEPPLVRGTMIDIRERKEAERALRESEAKYRRIVDTAHEGVWLIDGEGRTTFVNERMAEILGGSVEEILGKTMYDFMDDEARATAESNLEKRRDGIDEVHDFRFRRLDGSHVWTLLSTSALTDDDGGFLGALAMVADITSQRELEEKLRQAQKLEAVGRLAGGIAHDFNNIVTGILGAADLLAGLTEGEAEAGELVDEIRSAGERAGALTRQLLAFSRRQVVRPELVDLSAKVRELERVLARLIGERHELRVAAASPALVQADPAQLEQVMLNLVVNARDAQPDGGPIDLRVTVEGAWVVLEVEDRGDGVPAAIRDRIFEPFFTTKEDSGTGLGLSTVHGIVTGAGGTVAVRDGATGGAVFRVEIPSRAGEAASSEAESRTTARVDPGRLRILLVDDEDAVRRVVGQTLTEAGHEVIEAAGPGQALERLEERGAELDLLLTDLRMPELSGRELAARAAERHPHLRLVIMTGFADEGVQVEGRPDAVVLAKPFRAAELLDALAGSSGPVRRGS